MVGLTENPRNVEKTHHRQNYQPSEGKEETCGFSPSPLHLLHFRLWPMTLGSQTKHRPTGKEAWAMFCVQNKMGDTEKYMCKQLTRGEAALNKTQTTLHVREPCTAQNNSQVTCCLCLYWDLGLTICISWIIVCGSFYSSTNNKMLRLCILGLF